MAAATPLPYSSNPPDLAKIKRRAWVVCCICVLVICTVLGVIVGWVNRVRNFDDAASTTVPSGRSISFDVDLIAVDPSAGQITLDWYFLQDDLCSNEGYNETMCSLFVDIFFDQNLLRTSTSTDPADNNIPQQPVFRYNATAYLRGDIRNNIAAFRTSLALLSLDGSTSSLQNYPFDKYYGEISLFAQQSPTNESVDLEIGYTQGVAIGFKTDVVYNLKSEEFTDAIYNELIVSRGGLVKAFAVVIVGSVWVITLVFLASTVTTVVFGYPQRIELLVVPVPLLFTITQLRTTMPGAPPFGAIIDYIGLLPCIALMSICAVVSAMYLVFSHPDKDRETFTDRLMSRAFRNKLQSAQKEQSQSDDD